MSFASFNCCSRPQLGAASLVWAIQPPSNRSPDGLSGKNSLDELPVHRRIGDVEAVVGAVDVQPRAVRARRHDPDAPEPVVGDALVQKRPVAARHVEANLVDAVKLRLGIDLVERDHELHLGVRVELHGLDPRRLPLQPDRGVGHRLRSEVERHRVIGLARHGGEHGVDVVELFVHLGPLVGRDVDRVGLKHALVEEIRARRPGAAPGPPPVPVVVTLAASCARRRNPRRRPAGPARRDDKPAHRAFPLPWRPSLPRELSLRCSRSARRRSL